MGEEGIEPVNLRIKNPLLCRLSCSPAFPQIRSSEPAVGRMGFEPTSLRLKVCGPSSRRPTHMTFRIVALFSFSIDDHHGDNQCETQSFSVPRIELNTVVEREGIEPTRASKGTWFTAKPAFLKGLTLRAWAKTTEGREVCTWRPSDLPVLAKILWPPKYPPPDWPRKAWRWSGKWACNAHLAACSGTNLGEAPLRLSRYTGYTTPLELCARGWLWRDLAKT